MSSKSVAKRELEHERMFAKEGEEVLTDLGILIEAHPANALDDLRLARRIYKAACNVLEGPDDASIEGEGRAGCSHHIL